VTKKGKKREGKSQGEWFKRSKKASNGRTRGEPRTGTKIVWCSDRVKKRKEGGGTITNALEKFSTSFQTIVSRRGDKQPGEMRNRLAGSGDHYNLDPEESEAGGGYRKWGGEEKITGKARTGGEKSGKMRKTDTWAGPTTG